MDSGHAPRWLGVSGSVRTKHIFYRTTEICFVKRSVSGPNHYVSAKIIRFSVFQKASFGYESKWHKMPNFRNRKRNCSYSDVGPIVEYVFRRFPSLFSDLKGKAKEEKAPQSMLSFLFAANADAAIATESLHHYERARALPSLRRFESYPRSLIPALIT